MKKFTLFLLAVLATSLSFAGVKPLDGKRLPKVRNTMERVAKQRNADKQLALRKAPRRAPAGVINVEEQPEGKAVEMIASYGGLYYSWFGTSNLTTDAGAITLVEGTDGNLYIKGLTPALYDNELYWIKAEKTGEGEYVAKKQPAGYYSNYDEVDYLTLLDYDAEEGWFYESENTDLKLTYKDGILAVADPEVYYGIVYEDEGEWEWEGEVYWELTAEPMTETYATLPENVEAEAFVLKHEDGAKSVQLAVVGNEVYVQSYGDVPGWYVGTISGSKVTFKSGQFLGYDSYYDSYEWLVAATVKQEYDEDYEEYYWTGEIADEMTFDYDAEAKTLTAPANTALYINGAKDRIYYAEAYINPKFFIFNEVPATPADPVITNFWEYDEYYESAELDFNIPQADVDGNYITPDKLSYRVYIDDELFTIDGDEYETFDGQYTELPYGFSDGSWIGSTYLCIFFDPAKNIGLQSIYRGAGVENVSNIVYYDVESGEIYAVDKDGNLVDGIILSRNNGNKTAATYDLTGRRVSDNARGLLLKTVTLGDGTLKTVKVIKK